jgi:hypothetical protein
LGSPRKASTEMQPIIAADSDNVERKVSNPFARFGAASFVAWSSCD